MEGYRNKLTAQQLTGGRVGGVVGLVERELRERLKMQEREMAEQKWFTVYDFGTCRMSEI